MKLNLIVEQSDKDLRLLFETTQTELAEAIIQLKTQKVPNVKRIGNIKKTIAQVLTIERQRQLTAASKLELSQASEPQHPTKKTSKDRPKRSQ